MFAWLSAWKCRWGRGLLCGQPPMAAVGDVCADGANGAGGTKSMCTVGLASPCGAGDADGANGGVRADGAILAVSTAVAVVGTLLLRPVAVFLSISAYSVFMY